VAQTQGNVPPGTGGTGDEPVGERNSVPDPLPPGQTWRSGLPVMHYGPVPKVKDPDGWLMWFWGWSAVGPGNDQDLELGQARTLTLADVRSMDQSELVSDLHCGQKWSVRGTSWQGVRARDVVDRFPPGEDVRNVMVFAEYGYSATVRLEDLTSSDALLATHLHGEPLTPEHGFPIRLVVPHLYSWKGPKWFRGWEYLREPRRGFWEERGYHITGDPWHEQRYSYQET